MNERELIRRLTERLRDFELENLVLNRAILAVRLSNSEIPVLEWLDQLRGSEDLRQGVEQRYQPLIDLAELAELKSWLDQDPPIEL